MITQKLTQKMIKIVDFGICSNKEYNKKFEGTDLYMAP